jgi:hypothetical protein
MFPNNRLIAILAFPYSATRSNALRHHFGGEPLKEIKGALKVLSVTADHAMSQPTFLKVADVVNDRLGTPRERKSTTIAALLLGSDAAVDGEYRARNLARITADPFRLGTHFCKSIAIELRGIEWNARISGDGVPAIAEPARTFARTGDLTTDPNRRMRKLLRLRGEQHLIECCV